MAAESGDALCMSLEIQLDLGRSGHSRWACDHVGEGLGYLKVGIWLVKSEKAGFQGITNQTAPGNYFPSKREMGETWGKRGAIHCSS